MFKEAFTAEEWNKKQHIKHLLIKGGYKKYAQIFDKFDFHLTSRKGVTAYLAPNDGAIYCNRGWSDKYLSVLIRHEILHEWLDHQLRLMRKLCDEHGLNYDDLTKQSFEDIQQELYSNSLFNIAGDYEISNRGYTAADKDLIHNMELNGEVFSGLVTEDEHPDWIKMSIEEMYDELRKLMPKQPEQPQGPRPKGHVVHGTFNDKGEFVDTDGDIVDPDTLFGEQEDESLTEANHQGYDSYIFVDDNTNKSYIYKDGQFICLDDLQGDEDGPDPDNNQPSPEWDDDFPVDPKGGKDNDNQNGDKHGAVPRDDYQKDKNKKDNKQGKSKQSQDNKQSDNKQDGQPGSDGSDQVDDKQDGSDDGFKKADWDNDEQSENGSSDNDQETPINDFRNGQQGEESEEDKELAKKEKEDREKNDVSGKYDTRNTGDRLKDIKRIQDEVRYKDLGDETKKVDKKEIADKNAKEYRRQQSLPLNRFKADVRNFVAKQVGDIEEIDTWSNPKRRYAGIGVPAKGTKELESHRPLINVYFDNSGSWTSPSYNGTYPYELGERALDVLSDMERKGEIEMRVRYFSSDRLYTKPLGRNMGGGTYATPVFNDILATRPDNVIIMTDSDFDGTDGDRQPNIVVPGAVWFLFYGSECKSVQEHLKGKQETKKFYLSEEE